MFIAMRVGTDAGALSGVCVLVTRPAHQAGRLMRLIEQQGGRAVGFPVLEIQPPQDDTSLRRAIDRLDSFDLAIFISANAVERALPVILARRDWPDSLHIASIGKRTAQVLAAAGHPPDVCPDAGFNSEALLALPQLRQVAGQRVVIFRGSGGREYLAEQLRARGAEVHYAEAYRRVRPATDPAELNRAGERGEFDIVLVNSAESLRNLYHMVGVQGRRWLLATPLLVVSERMPALAQELGFEQVPRVADNATDEAVLAALLAWRRKDGGTDND